MAGYRLWSNVPGSLYWGVPNKSLGNNTSSENLQDLSLSRRRSPSKGLPNSSLKVSLNYYDHAGDEDTDCNETDILVWVSEDETRGVVRVYHPGSTFSELVKCTVSTDVETVISRCVAEELHVHYGNSRSQVLDLDSCPLETQNQFLRDIGHSDVARIQLEGIQSDLCHMFKFVAGRSWCVLLDKIICMQNIHSPRLIITDSRCHSFRPKDLHWF